MRDLIASIVDREKRAARRSAMRSIRILSRLSLEDLDRLGELAHKYAPPGGHLVLEDEARMDPEEREDFRRIFSLMLGLKGRNA